MNRHGCILKCTDLENLNYIHVNREREKERRFNLFSRKIKLSIDSLMAEQEDYQ